MDDKIKFPCALCVISKTLLIGKETETLNKKSEENKREVEVYERIYNC